MSIQMIPSGALTASVTPFNQDGSVDMDGMRRLVQFQKEQGISGIVPAGTTGESPTLTPQEHCGIIGWVMSGIFVLAGCGSNSTAEAMYYVGEAVRRGCKAVLLVDPYYNRPPSCLLVKEYYAPIAAAFPDIAIMPYIIPGRTNTECLAEDLATLSEKFPNICGIKDATGKLEHMRKVRSLARPDFQIFCGDDGMTFDSMSQSLILAHGVISVVSNIAPAAVQKMCQLLLAEQYEEANALKYKLQPLFDIVTVSVNRVEGGRDRDIVDRFSNPMPIKTAMNMLGMPSGPCRQPLGKMSEEAVNIVRRSLAIVYEESPAILRPVEEFFSVDIGQRLADERLCMSFAQ